MLNRISDKELDLAITKAINEELEPTGGLQIPEGRDLNIELKSLKTRVRFVDFKNIGPESKLASPVFKKLLVNSDKYSELFDKIKMLVCGKIKKIEGAEFMLRTNSFQLSNDDKTIFLLFEKVFNDFSDEDDVPYFSENKSIEDDLATIESDVNGKISKFGMSVNLQFSQQHIIVLLKTPFDFAEYNNEIDKYMR